MLRLAEALWVLGLGVFRTLSLAKVFGLSLTEASDDQPM